MDKIEQRALQAKRLREDEAFVSFVAEVRDAQTAIFLNPASSDEDRASAHHIVRAIHQIEQKLKSAETDLLIEQKKGQHRGSD
ncbi:MAG: hypothetical protein ACK4NW_01960 [Roseinatronobacter sp.]